MIVIAKFVGMISTYLILAVAIMFGKMNEIDLKTLPDTRCIDMGCINDFISDLAVTLHVKFARYQR